MSKDATSGQTIGHYQVIEEIGRGGMGKVLLARDTRLGRRVAIKVLHREYTRDGQRVRRFEQEARAASALNHPTILVIHEIGEENGTRFIRAVELGPGNASYRARLARAYAVAGRRDEAKRLLESLTANRAASPISHYQLALVHEALGERDAALAWLERGVVEEPSESLWLKVDPQVDALRSAPRYAAAVRRLRLTP